MGASSNDSPQGNGIKGKAQPPVRGISDPKSPWPPGKSRTGIRRKPRLPDRSKK